MQTPSGEAFAEFSQAERREAPSCEAQRRAKRGTVRCAKRSPPLPQAPAPAEGSAEGATALRAVFKGKLEATKLEANSLGVNKRIASSTECFR